MGKFESSSTTQPGADRASQNLESLCDEYLRKTSSIIRSPATLRSLQEALMHGTSLLVLRHTESGLSLHHVTAEEILKDLEASQPLPSSEKTDD